MNARNRKIPEVPTRVIFPRIEKVHVFTSGVVGGDITDLH